MYNSSSKNSGQKELFDGWNVALAAADIIEDRAVYARYCIEEYQAQDLTKVFPDAVHPDCDKIIPDSILPWNKTNKK